MRLLLAALAAVAVLSCDYEANCGCTETTTDRIPPRYDNFTSSKKSFGYCAKYSCLFSSDVDDCTDMDMDCECDSIVSFIDDGEELAMCASMQCSSTLVQSDCFPAAALAVVRGQEKPVPVSRLRVGDVVLTGAGWSPVITVLHRSSLPADYVVAAHGDAVFRASRAHLVATGDSGFVFADALAAGDSLVLADGSPSRVTAVWRERRAGAFAPVTAAGTIVVDGVVASCYAEIRWHSWAHALFATLRWAHRALGVTLEGHEEPHAVWKGVHAVSRAVLPASAFH